MIKLDVFYELGNQLFMYAYARALSLEYDEPIVINTKTAFALIARIRFFPNAVKCHYRLNYFNIIPCKMQNPIIGFIQSIPPSIHMLIHRWNQIDEKKTGDLYLKMTAKGKHYFTDTAFARYYPHQRSDKPKKHLHGVWVSEKSFAHFAEVIRKELRVITPLSDNNRDLINEMRDCNSIAIHFRKGEFASIKRFDIDVNICSEDYYRRGMRYIAEHVSNPIFYIFSNDIMWVKKNISFEYPVRYVDYNNAAHEDLRLMYNCKHFINANSTFSWWASYLSDNPAKIVIVPSYWNKRYPDKYDVYRKDMVLLNPDSSQ